MVINTSPDTVEMLRIALEQADFTVFSGYTYEINTGHVNLESMLRIHEPNVVLYDIAPPYDRNWDLFQNLQRTILKDCPVVLTATNPARVREMVGANDTIYEIVGKPYDLDKIVRAAKEAAGQRRP
jgi:DNA-binding NtrC family response regulator